MPTTDPVSRRMKAIGVEHYTEASPEDAARAVEELAHIALGMDMGTWSRIAGALLGCVGRCVRLEEQLLQHAEVCKESAWPLGAPPHANTTSAEDISTLMRFYDVTTLEGLVLMQNIHVERLQAKLPVTLVSAVNHVREG